MGWGSRLQRRLVGDIIAAAADGLFVKVESREDNGFTYPPEIYAIHGRTHQTFVYGRTLPMGVADPWKADIGDTVAFFPLVTPDGKRIALRTVLIKRAPVKPATLPADGPNAAAEAPARPLDRQIGDDLQGLRDHDPLG